MANGTRESCHMAVHSIHSSLPHCVLVGIAIKSSQCCLAVGCLAGPRLAIRYLGKASDSVIFFFLAVSFRLPFSRRAPVTRHIPKGTAPFVASNVPFGVWLETTLSRLGCSNYLTYLKVMSRLEK